MGAHLERTSLAARSSAALDRIENFYLKALRATLLVAATILLLCAAGWAAISLTRILKSADSVVEKSSNVAATDILEIDSPTFEGGAKPNTATSNTAYRIYYDDFVKRYFALYRAKYEPSLRADDKRLTIGEFDDLTINSAERIKGIDKGRLNFTTDRADLNAYLPVITEASSDPSTRSHLAKYRAAKKQPIVMEVQRTRTEMRRGWDSFSEACAAWYESPIGCPVSRAVDVPYTQKVTVMRYPDGIMSPNQTLKKYQEKYFLVLADRRQKNLQLADSERQDILKGQALGWSGLSQSVLIIGAFLALMFFFLLVAIERHQRRLSIALP